MNMEQRRRQMLDLINREGSVSFGQLKTAFSPVSEMTLRRDLEYLDRQKRIIRTHGGARSAEVLVGTDDLYLWRSTRNAAGKRIIAEKAVQLLQQNGTIFLDSGSTCTEFARQIPDGPYMIFTTSVSCALELSRLQQATIYLLGGRMNTASLCVNGSMTMRELESINFQTAFLGTTGYMHERGFTCGAEADGYLKHTALQRAEKTVMLMDVQKVGVTSTFTFAQPEDIDVLITDLPLDESDARHFLRSGTELL